MIIQTSFLFSGRDSPDILHGSIQRQTCNLACFQEFELLGLKTVADGYGIEYKFI